MIRELGRFRLRSMGLGTRIALTMLGAALAIQALNSAAFLLLPPPDIKIFSARWIIAQTVKVVDQLADAGEAERKPVAERFTEATGLRLTLIRDRPPKPTRNLGDPALQRLADSLDQTLAGKVRRVTVHAFMGPPGPFPWRAPIIVPPEFEHSLPRGPILANEPDIPIWSDFDIEIEQLDGRRVEISAKRPPRSLVNPMFVSLGGAIAVIALLSALTAKRSLKPLEELVSAARRLGVQREPTRVATEHLGDFAAIGEALNEMQIRIKGFVDERTQSLAAISHDLRTFLTRFRLEAEVLPENETKARLIADIEEMEAMISATLTFAGDDLKAERSQTVDVAAILITICDTFTDMGGTAVYQGPDHALAMCQPIAIKRALTNLIDNAVKYGKEARTSLVLEPGTLVIAVADSGPGIDSDQIELAFKPFRRLEQSRNRETGGVGLGLTIARDIVLAHGGTIALTRNAEGGLLATVRLPNDAKRT